MFGFSPFSYRPYSYVKSAVSSIPTTLSINALSQSNTLDPTVLIKQDTLGLNSLVNTNTLSTLTLTLKNSLPESMKNSKWF